MAAGSRREAVRHRLPTTERGWRSEGAGLCPDPQQAPAKGLWGRQRGSCRRKVGGGAVAPFLLPCRYLTSS